MLSRLKALGALVLAAAGRGLAFAVLLALLGLGALGVVFILIESIPPTPRVAEEHPPLGGEPIRVVMGELELDIPRIGIVRITPAHGDTLDLFKGSDRSTLAELEVATEGEQIPIRGVSFTFYSAFGSRCRLPERLEFLCEYGRQGELPLLLTFNIGRFDPDRSDRTQARVRDFENAAQAGTIDYSEAFSMARRGDGGFVFRGRNDHNLIISCPAPLCFQNGEVEGEYNYGIRYSIEVENPENIQTMASIHERIVAALIASDEAIENREGP